jgi:branched-chain amino acid transport system substrate-binding protein
MLLAAAHGARGFTARRAGDSAKGQFKPLGDHVRQAFDIWEKINPRGLCDMVEGDDGCSEEAGADAAAAMTEAGVDIVVGFLCTESLAAALPLLSAEGIPVMTLTVRADIIGEEAARLGWRFFRLAPRAGSEAEIAADAILRLWADKSFALIEDGAISGRELVEAVRVILENRGLKPNFVDNYRPGQATQPSLVRRLKSAGVSRVFVGGERSDIAVIAMEADLPGCTARIHGRRSAACAAGRVAPPRGHHCRSRRRRHPRGRRPKPRKAAFEDQGLIRGGVAHSGLCGGRNPRRRRNPDGYTARPGSTRLLRSTTFSTALGHGHVSTRTANAANPASCWRSGATAPFIGSAFEDMARFAGEEPDEHDRPERNLITDVAGLRVGNASDHKLNSGVTAIVCDPPATAAVQVLGGAPGTRETDLLEPHNTVETVNGIILSGGSAFGLDAASGAQACLREQGKGFEVGPHRIPLVPAAILFDLINGGDKDWGRISALPRTRLPGHRSGLPIIG